MTARIFILITLFLSACQTSSPRNIDIDYEKWDSQLPGTVVKQSSEKLEYGFYDVSKSIVNFSSHWEGVGHFGYIYYRNIEVCKCSNYDTVISPNGEFIIYHSQKNNRLEIFKTSSKEVSELSKLYIGYPKSAKWDLNGKTASISLSKPPNEATEEIQISLN